MFTLFEYDNYACVENPQLLNSYLQRIWQDQLDPLSITSEVPFMVDEISESNFQPFLTFNGNLIRARNYVGFIQTSDVHIEIYPKVFKSHPTKPSLMLRHIFFWFDFCRKWKFPFNKSNLDSFDNIELPELIIYLMATKLLDTVSASPISLYQSVEESLYIPKGKINFNRYLVSGLINGNHHIIDCEHEPFVFDNKLNRAIKYTSRLLLNRTKFAENQNLLQELIFILDDVKDQSFSCPDLETITLNPLFSDYFEVKDICQIVLQQLLYANQQFDLSQWSLLFPMEYIFEDFIAGFLETKFSTSWKVEYQKSNMNLSVSPNAFQMKHDILLTSRENSSLKIIVDTKYKLRPTDFKSENKKGVSQTDMYQMVSYAFRRGCTNVLILYPNIDETVNKPDTFIVQSGFPGAECIKITTAEITFWSISNFNELSTILQADLASILNEFQQKNSP